MQYTTDVQDSILLAAVHNGSSEAEEALVLRYTPLVYRQVRSCYREGFEKSDFVQEGLVGLLLAIRNYNDQKGPFPAYAITCVRNSVFSALRHSLSERASALDSFVSLSDLQESALQQLFNPSEDELERLINNEEVKSLYKLLTNDCSSLEKKVLSAWLAGYSTEETAKALSRTQKSIDNALFRVRCKASKLGTVSQA